MSSRALRKAAKEREKHDLERHVEDEASDEDLQNSKQKQSAFAMLSEAQDESGDDGEQEASTGVKLEDADPGASDEKDVPISKAQPSHRKKKRKGKKKYTEAATTQASDTDDIDAALKSLSTEETKKSGLPPYNRDIANEIFAADSNLLSVDPKHLHVGNEMRRVFGRAAFTADKEERADRQSQVMEGGTVGLAEAVSGRAARGGPGLPAVLRRRNIFVQGNEEWPKATNNGLMMEVEKREASGITTYRFVHMQDYKMSQMLFAQAVTAMDPMNMVNTLRISPYHVGTLLQVSEIAKHEKDNATAGELLERALFAFGKALHPSFAIAMGQGKARLDFRRPENREFFLAAWKYINNIGMRATWRTAYEWAKLLLALDPDNDPYCISLMIDQLALRARELDSFLNLATSGRFIHSWSGLPNIQYSVSLAIRLVDKKSTRSSQLLKQTVSKFPWIAARLFQQLDITKIPPAVWGQTATTQKDILHCELYAMLAQDVWKLPDAKAFLSETVATMSAEDTRQPRHSREPSDINEARYVILTDQPSLIGLLPKELTKLVNSMSDPLPPDDSIEDYDQQFNAVGQQRPGTLIRENPRRFMHEMMSLQQFVESFIPSGGDEVNGREDALLTALESMGDEMAGSGRNEASRNVQRLMDFRAVLSAQPEQRLEFEGASLTLPANQTLAQYIPATGEEEPALFGLDPENSRRIQQEIEEEMRALEAAESPVAEEGE